MSNLLSPKDIIRARMCIGCGSCVAQAESSNTMMQFDSYGELKPLGPSDWFHQSSQKFTMTCPFSPSATNETQLAKELYPTAEHKNVSVGNYQLAYVGHVSEDEYRTQGSSGGLVSWVASELLRRGLIDGVAHVVATEDPQNEGRYFRYRISRTDKEIREGAKSRYYPVELSEVLKIIHEVPGRYAVVGIPCFIKAVQLLRREDPVYRERIQFTLGLFCGHMKSARFVESFAWQMNVPVSEIKQVDFRYKYPNRPANWYNAMLTLKDDTTLNKDWWHLADGDWGAGFFMNSACNFCDDVVAETADISFGDAWVEPYSSDGRGTNVMLVRSPIIGKIIAEAITGERLKLDEVSGEFVEQTQAAGFRQRREGLAYRLTWAPNGLQPVKRVVPDADELTGERKKIYAIRYRISSWSHRIFWLARKLNRPQIYIRWARIIAAVYHGLAYHKGKVGEMTKRFSQFKG